MMGLALSKILFLIILTSPFSHALKGIQPDFGETIAGLQRVTNEDFGQKYGEILDQKQFLLVGGFGNETVRPIYLADNVKALRDIGVSTVNRFFPSSFHSPAWNTKIIYDEIHRLFRENGSKPLVLMGHSKGGLEVLATILEYPELIRGGIVTDVILIQAPVGGNTMADNQNRFKKAFLATALSLTAYGSLQTADIQQSISQKINDLSPEDRAALSPVVKYIISSKEPERMGGFLGSIGKRFNPGVLFDGLVAHRDMWLPGFGTVIGDLKDFDHLESTLHMPLPFPLNSVPNRIRGFMLGVAAHIAQSRQIPDRGTAVPVKSQGPERKVTPEKVFRCSALL
jgi:pimeloyl-ACP methyl ester carboxylesterase